MTDMKNKKSESLAQSSALTESRYDFNRLEKNALYCIIRKVREVYVEQPSEHKAYSNMRLDIPESVMAEIADEKHRAHAKKALVNLRKRDVTIEDEEGNWMNTGFISMAKYSAKEKKFTVEVSSEIMPHLVDLAERFTVYSLTVAIALKSKWAQRFYELCCQYKNHLENGIPVFHKSIEQLRTMFMLEDKYPKLPDFKSRIIDKAQKDLKEAFDEGQCDLWFDYGQTGRGEKAQFSFVIHTREQNKAQQMQFKELSKSAYSIFKTLMAIFPRDTKFCEKCWKHLELRPDKIEPLQNKLSRLLKNYPGAKDRAKITRFMLAEDFDMSNKSLK